MLFFEYFLNWCVPVTCATVPVAGISYLYISNLSQNYDEQNKSISLAKTQEESLEEKKIQKEGESKEEKQKQDGEEESEKKEKSISVEETKTQAPLLTHNHIIPDINPMPMDDRKNSVPPENKGTDENSQDSINPEKILKMAVNLISNSKNQDKLTEDEKKFLEEQKTNFETLLKLVDKPQTQQ